MTVKLELNPEIEASLAAQAHARGLSLESYLDQVIQRVAVSPTQAEAVQRARDLGDSNPIQRARDLAENRERHHRQIKGRKSLSQLFAESPFKGLDLEFERDPDTGRPVTL